MTAALLDLATLDVAPAKTADNLTVVPLLRRNTPLPYWLTLDEAMAQGVVRITEVSEGGSVPTLLFLNNADKPVLLRDGEKLVGAKQNRVLNLTLLVPANSELKIPVSCVERGRWSWRGRHFEPANRALHSSARAAKMRDVSHSMRSRDSYESDQRSVWAAIDDKLGELHVSSHTSAAADMYEQRAVTLDAMVSALKAEPDQVGAAFLIDGRLAGVELFGATSSCTTLLPKLLRSYGLEALSTTMTGSVPAQPADAANTVLSFLQSLMAAPSLQKPALGLGEDYRYESATQVGAGLVNEGALVHLAGFVRH